MCIRDRVIERDGKFYWYVTVEHGTIHGKSIGVAVSDSPVGPFVDARGSAPVSYTHLDVYKRQIAIH